MTYSPPSPSDEPVPPAEAGGAEEPQPAAAHGVAGEWEMPAARTFDWLTEFAIPACILGLLSSFLYYLLEVRGALGAPVNALHWVGFWFVLAVVGISRIRTKYGSGAVALPYILGLGFAMLFFIGFFTMHGGSLGGGGASVVGALLFNYGLIILLWWAGNKLTRECTLEDLVEHAGDRGLMSGGKARHPGWVIVWFTIAALAVFAICQRAVVHTRGEGPPRAFMLMGAYAFFSLVLLGLTSLSSLRLRVKRRGLELDRRLSPLWVGLTVILVLIALCVATVLPRSPDLGRVTQTVAQLPEWVREHAGRGGIDGPDDGFRSADQETWHAGEDESGIASEADGTPREGEAPGRGRAPGEGGELGEPETRSRPEVLPADEEMEDSIGVPGDYPAGGGEVSGTPRGDGETGGAGQAETDEQGTGAGRPDEHAEEAGQSRQPGTQPGGQGQGEAPGQQPSGDQPGGAGAGAGDQQGESADEGRHGDETGAEQGEGETGASGAEPSDAAGEGSAEGQEGTGATQDEGSDGEPASGQQTGEEGAGEDQPSAAESAAGEDEQQGAEQGGGEESSSAGGEQSASGSEQSDQAAGSEAQETPQEGPETSGAGGGLSGLMNVFSALVRLLLWLLLLVALAVLLYFLVRWLRRHGWKPIREAVVGFFRMGADMLRETWRAVVGRLRAFLAALRGLLGRLRRARTTAEGLPKDRFADIFRDRTLADSLSPVQMAEHVYGAFMAYAELVGCGRRDHETPLEYVRRLPERLHSQRDDAEELTRIYVQAAYTPDDLDAEHVSVLQGIWQRMQPRIDEALAAHKAEGKLIRQRA